MQAYNTLPVEIPLYAYSHNVQCLQKACKQTSGTTPIWTCCKGGCSGCIQCPLPCSAAGFSAHTAVYHCPPAWESKTEQTSSRLWAKLPLTRVPNAYVYTQQRCNTTNIHTVGHMNCTSSMDTHTHAPCMYRADLRAFGDRLPQLPAVGSCVLRQSTAHHSKHLRVPTPTRRLSKTAYLTPIYPPQLMVHTWQPSPQ